MSDITRLEEENPEFAFGRLVEISKVSERGLATAYCPVHDDTDASMHITLDEGLWHCKGCGTGGKGLASLHQFIHGTDYADAIDELEVLLELKPKSMTNMDAYHKNLLASAEAMAYLKVRGINAQTIKNYNLGADSKRIYIPIYDFSGQLRNVRKHLFRKIDEVKSFSEEGLGEIRLYPVGALRADTVTIFEGELDALLALSNGINAVSITGGAGTWASKFNRYFKGKVVNICYDIDAAGTNGAKHVANELKPYAAKINIVALPTQDMPEKGDFTDFIRLKGIAAFKALKPVPFTGLTSEELGKVVVSMHLSETLHSTNYSKRIRTVALATGKGDVYGTPERVEARCKDMMSEQCAVCRVKRGNGAVTKVFAKDDPIHLRLIQVPDGQKTTLLRHALGIPEKCKKARVEQVSIYNIEEVLLIPEVDYATVKSSGYVSRYAYNITSTDMELNKPHKIEALTLLHPKDQKSTMLIYDAASTTDTIDAFVVDDSVVDKLKLFQANDESEMRRILKEKYDDYEAVTGIFYRRDLFLATDIIYHSLLSFDFQGKRIKRAHVNGLIFGDTRTGKSETVDSLMAHFRAGDATGGENVSFAGLVGGVHKVASDSKWGITWKIIPLNDRRLVKVDEFHEMDPVDIRKLSELVSTGVANIQKIHSERTMARTRLVFIANTRDGKHLADYQYGCQAIPDLMGGHNEDVARLDFAAAFAASDVRIEDIQELKKEKRQVKTYTSDVCHQLVMWAWSRKPSDISWEAGAEDLCVELATKQVNTYSAEIPLVPSAEHPVKLARIAGSIAAMFFSTSTGENVIIRKIHVSLAANFLDTLYGTEAMGFVGFSRTSRGKICRLDKQQLELLGFDEAIKDLLLSNESFSAQYLSHVFNVAMEDTRIKISFLLKHGALITASGYTYKKTPGFTRLLSNTIFDRQVEPMF